MDYKFSYQTVEAAITLVLENSLTFSELQSLVNKLAKTIIESGFRPTAIVAIPRGGWIPARLLSKPLGVRTLYSVGVRYTDATRMEHEFYSLPSPELEDETILLVEDFLETGYSLAYAKSFLEERNEVKTFALAYLPGRVIVPDFSLGQVTKIPVLPWE